MNCFETTFFVTYYQQTLHILYTFSNYVPKVMLQCLRLKRVANKQGLRRPGSDYMTCLSLAFSNLNKWRFYYLLFTFLMKITRGT